MFYYLLSWVKLFTYLFKALKEVDYLLILKREALFLNDDKKET